MWNYRDFHDQIRIDHFDHENFVTLEMVLVKFGLTIEPQFCQMIKKSWSLDPPS
jgi:hypothetical protein